jgi:hypothetical protein
MSPSTKEQEECNIEKENVNRINNNIKKEEISSVDKKTLNNNNASRKEILKKNTLKQKRELKIKKNITIKIIPTKNFENIGKDLNCTFKIIL